MLTHQGQIAPLTARLNTHQRQRRSAKIVARRTALEQLTRQQERFMQNVARYLYRQTTWRGRWDVWTGYLRTWFP